MALQLFSTGSHENPGFVEKVKQYVFPDIEPDNLQFPHARFIQNGLIAAQTFVECLRSNNVNFYDRDDVTVSCKVASLTGPNRARIQSVYAFKPERKCKRVHYEQKGVGAIACFGNSHGCCAVAGSAADIVFQSVMTGAAFCEQEDLVITENAFLCSERIWAKGTCDRIYLASMFPCDYKVAVHWEGIKQHYADTDLITDDEELLDLIALFLSGHRALRLDRDMDLHEKIMRKPQGRGDWGGTFWQALMDMKHRCREERRIRPNYLCNAIFDDNALVDACVLTAGGGVVEPDGCGVNQYEVDGECVDCETPLVTISASDESINLGESVTLSWASMVPDIASSVVTIEYGSTITTVTRNASGELAVSPTADTTYTIRAVTVCGTVTFSTTVAVTVVPPCVCPEGLPECLQLTKADPWDFTTMCNPVTDGIGDATQWDGKMQLLSQCRWGVEFSEDEDGNGGVYANFTTPTSGQFKAIIELISCDPFVYEMTFYTRAVASDVLTEYPFWKGRCIGHPVGNYVTQHFGVGVVDGYCYPDTDFEVEACFDDPCAKSVIRFDPPSGSTVNFPTLVFLHSTNNNDSIFYRISGGDYQPYVGPFSVQAGETVDAYAVTFDGCLGDVYSAEYIADTGLEFDFLCDGPKDKVGVFGEFAPNGDNNDYHWRIRSTRGSAWTFRNAKIYETDSEGNWVTGQAWATLNPIYPIELSPNPFSVYPMVVFNEVPTQLNFAYGDPVASFAAGLTTLHAYGQPFVPLTGYFRLEFTLDEGGAPFTIYKLIPHSCEPCPEAQNVVHYAECDGTITLTGTLQIGSTYRLYRAELAPCGSGVHSIVSEFIATQVPWQFLDSGTNDCSYSYFLSVYCPSAEEWIDGPISTVLVPPVCDVPTEFCSTAPIIIPTFGSSSPYPSTINVTERPGVVIKATVQIFGYRHSFPDDVEILLVGPDGTKVLLMNDVGGAGANQILSPGVDVLFDDAGAAAPDNGPRLMAGMSYTFSPTSYGATFFAGSAPPPPFATALSAFIGKPCNGAWKLYVNDDSGGESGAINGWCLNLSTS